MTREEKKAHLAETLNIRPSTASIAVDMLEQQKMFLATIARNEYNRGVTDVLDILDEEIYSYKRLGKQDSQHREVLNALMNFRRSIVKLEEGEQE